MAVPLQRPQTSKGESPRYKWIVLSNTTLGVLMAMINSSIMLISLPAIFRGLGINPLLPSETSYLLWLLLGYMVVMATLLVTLGRISDLVGRVRMYNLGFTIFTAGSILLFLAPGSGNQAALELIIFRLVQGVGGAFLFANSTAILIDAFPASQRGMAIGFNQIAAIAGSLGGLLLGGALAAINWHLIFLVSVPFGVFGTAWAYLKLHETAVIRAGQRLDVLGNTLFGVGLTALLIGLTYGIMPYGGSSMGWTNPFVIACVIGGLALLAIFVVVEQRVPDPMFRLALFKNRVFSAGNLALLLGSIARGGLQFMLIMWLQGIWLPLHGYSFESTPLWAGIYTMPLMAGFLLMGPLSGWLSDRFGARIFTTGGMLVSTVGFLSLTLLPGDFAPAIFLALLLLLGLGMGLFSAPNTTAVMNVVPADQRGAASGMRATFQNTGTMLSMSFFFTIVTIGLAGRLPGVLYSGLTHAGISTTVAHAVAGLPPTAALFSAFLGYNPMGALLPHQTITHLAVSTRASLLGTHFFPSLIMPAFMVGMRDAFYVSAALSLIAAGASWLKARRVTSEGMATEAARAPRQAEEVAAR